MMSERRALLDPEMYKISEEDSQDEEVLASYTEDALKLGGGGAEDLFNGNPALSVGRHSRVSWNAGGSRYSSHGDNSLRSWEYSGDLTSSQFNPNKLRVVHGLTTPARQLQSYHQQRQRFVTGGSPCARAADNTAKYSEDQDNSVDWPETSSNSDSCVSGDERERIRGRRAAPASSAATSSGLSAFNNNKFFSKTYFGDHLRHRSKENEQDEGEDASGGRRSSNSSSTYLHQHPQLSNTPASSYQQQARSRHLQKRSRRRNARNAQDDDDGELSTSGSNCSDNEVDHRTAEGNESSSSTSSGSPCAECLAGSTRHSGSMHSQTHRHRRRSNITSSSEVEEYDSSYSDSSYGDHEEDDEDDYDRYYDEEDEGDECFDDIVKFLSDDELEASTNADGDLFLVEYSADELDERVSFRDPSASVSRSETQLQFSHPTRSHKQSGDDSTSHGVAGHDATPRNSHTDAECAISAAVTGSNSSVASSSVGHFQKSSTGKGAKGRISRLLKRKRDTPSSAKTPPESSCSAPAAPPAAASQSSIASPTSSSQLVQPTCSSSGSSHVPVPTTTHSRLSGSVRKQKESNLPSNTTSSTAPEKVFRFKDEHGGEIRTVFVDIPQSARTGNLLGRRATLIESILGIIPDHFSTPPTSDGHGHQHTSFPESASRNDRIMVAGFVPDGAASKYRRIKIGDWLQSVDDIPVDHVNVDQVLNSRSMYGKRRTAFETEYLRLKLTLRRVAGCMVSLPPTSSSQQRADSPENASVPKPSATRSITEPCWSVVSPVVQANVAILFISSNVAASANSTKCGVDDEPGESSPQPDPGSQAAKEKSKDVVYSWPIESESKMVKALAASQGMFSTLYRLLWDVTGSHPVVSKVIIDDCEMDVTYSSEDQGKSLLLVGVATSLSVFTVNHPHSQQTESQQKSRGDKGYAGLSAAAANRSSAAGPLAASGTAAPGETKRKEKKIRWREPQAGGVTVSTRVLHRIENLVKYQFGSFARAFQDENLEKLNRLLTNSLSALNDLSEDFLFLQVPGNFLRFPSCIRSGIDDVLYSFETSDALNMRVCITTRASRATSGSSRRRTKDSPSESDLPVYHCHGSCLMYKGFLITSHLENELASSFHGWWRTQLGLWQGVKRNALVDRWKPVSRLALWQETSILKKNAPSSLSDRHESATGHGQGDSSAEASAGDFPAADAPPQPIRCFSGLVGIGNFTLGFVLEHLTDYQGSVGPDMYWLRRAMETICRLYHSGLSRSFECWLEEKRDGREEYVELCGTAGVTSSKHPHNAQEKLGGIQGSGGSRSGTLTLKKTPATGSILKHTEPSNLLQQSCPVHSLNTVVVASTNLAASSSTATCSCSQKANSSPVLQSFMMGSSSTSSSSSSSFGGSGVRSGIMGGMTSTPSDDFSAMIRPHPVGCDAGDSDGGDDLDADDTTTGTGSDNSSFKWYERAANESNFLTSSRVSGSDIKQIRVTRGNVLLDYVQVEFGRGVMLSSADIHEGWAAVVRHNFRQSATVIHHILHKAANARQRLEERGNDKKWVSLALAPISEHGVLFSCQLTNPRDVHKKKPRKREINYWVVGRIYPDEREIYVCFEDGPLSQNLVEIAYKMALNVHC